MQTTRTIQVKRWAKLALALVCVAAYATPVSAQRNSKWAMPVQAKHAENFYVVDEGVYRSGQPSAEAFAEMEKMGIKEVLNLRSYHNDLDEAKGTQLMLHRIDMEAQDSKWDELTAAVRLIKDRKGPIVVHCWHGSDRTGIVIALYRVVIQGWTKDDAIDELQNGGYGFHSVYGNIITFIRNMDVEEFRKDISQAS